MANVYAGNAQLAVNSIVCAMGSYLLVAYSTTDLLDDDDAGRRHRAAAATASTLTQPMLSDAQHTVNVDLPRLGSLPELKRPYRRDCGACNELLGHGLRGICAVAASSERADGPESAPHPSTYRLACRWVQRCSTRRGIHRAVCQEEPAGIQVPSGDILYGVAKDDVTAVNPEPAETSERGLLWMDKVR